MNISPVTLKENRIHLNPAIFKLKSKLDLFINAKAEAKSPEKENVKNNVLLISYASSILSLSFYEIASKYGKNVKSPISKYIKPKE